MRDFIAIVATLTLVSACTEDPETAPEVNMDPNSIDLQGPPQVSPSSKWEIFGNCSNGDRSLRGSQNFSATAHHQLQGDRISCLGGTSLFVLFFDEQGSNNDELLFTVNVAHDRCETRREWALPPSDFETKSDAENFATVDRETRRLLEEVSEACGSELRSPGDFGQFERQVHEIFEVVRRQREVNARTVDGVIPPHLRN